MAVKSLDMLNLLCGTHIDAVLVNTITKLFDAKLWRRASVKLFELGVRTPGRLLLGVWYAGGIDFRRFRTPSLPIFGAVLGLLEATKMYKRRRSTEC